MVEAFECWGLRGRLSLGGVWGTQPVRKGLRKAGSRSCEATSTTPRSLSRLLWGPSRVCDGTQGKEE